MEEKLNENCLLNKSDFLLIQSEANDYVFLSETLQLLKITNPKIKSYLDLCDHYDRTASNGSLSSNDNLSDEEIRKFRDIFLEMNKKEERSKSVLSKNFLVLNVEDPDKSLPGNTKMRMKSMTSNDAMKAIDLFLHTNPEAESYAIYFIGDEPLANKNALKSVTEYAYNKIVVNLKKKVHFWLNTSENSFDPEMISFFKQYEINITINVDNPQYLHDESRIYLDGENSFMKVLSGVDQLKKNGINVNFRAILNPKSKDLIEIFDLFENIRIPYTYAFSLCSNNTQINEYPLDNNEINRINRELKKLMVFFVNKIRTKQSVYCSGLKTKLTIIHNKISQSQGFEVGGYSMDDQMQSFKPNELFEIAECELCALRNLCGGGNIITEHLVNDEGKYQINQQRCRLHLIEWKNILFAYSMIMN